MRMLRQMGMFLYDTLDYRMLGKSDLEDLIGTMKVPPGPDSDTPAPILIKIFVPKSIASGVFARLEIIGMTGARLLDAVG